MRFWFKVAAGSGFDPPRLLARSSSRILKYVEDLEREPNAGIGPNDIVEIASRQIIGLTTRIKADLQVG